ncbi:hypothetical protein HI914_05903, partial [Erysiphe necator]
MLLRSNRIYQTPVNKKSESSSASLGLVETTSEETINSAIQPISHIEEFIENVHFKMDFKQVSVAQRSSTAIRLEKWQDWPLWFDQLKIWYDVNPEANEEQPVNNRPTAPSPPTELSKNDLALKNLDENLKLTVGDQFKRHLMGKITERAKLKSHFENFKPAVASIKADQKAEFELLKSTRYGKPVNNYFSGWQILSIKCKTKEYSIFLTGEKDPSLALHDALQPIHPVTAIFRANQVNENANAGIVIRLVDEIKASDVNNIDEVENIGAALLPGSVSSCSLYDKVILDSGTNIHVINNTVVKKIISSREASSKDRVYLGNDILQADAVVKAESNRKQFQNGKDFNIDGYPTSSPTVSRQNCEEADLNDLFVDDLDPIENANVAGANIYLGVFSSTLVLKQNESNNLRIHRDQLERPPTSWRELM